MGDPQVDNPTELEYARKSVFSELGERKDLNLVVILGDLVNENPSLIGPAEASLDSITMKTGCQWVRVNGNHDGPGPAADTSFVKSGIRFILMDNVRRKKRGGYEGGLREEQKQWLDSLMSATEPSERIVFCTHIPVSQSKGRDSLFNILACHRDVLFICGHTHCVSRQTLERGMEEVQAGASCGSWWRGGKDAGGIPYALMNCGAPRGYFTADFRPRSRKWYNLRYKCVGREEAEQCSVSEIGGKLYVNVYGGSRDGRVYVKLPGRLWEEIPHCYAIAPEVRDVIDSVSAMSSEYRKAHKDEVIPLRKLPSPHVWAGKFDGSLPSGKVCRVRYSDGTMSFKSYFCLK